MKSTLKMNAGTDSHKITGKYCFLSTAEDVSLLSNSRDKAQAQEGEGSTWCGIVLRKNYLSLDSGKRNMEKLKKVRSSANRFGINQTMIPYKMFYFLSDGASSCIAPYRSLYLKQLGLGPSRIGVVAAMKPLATFISNAMIGFLADRFGWRKAIMLTSLMIWIASLLALGFIPPASEVPRLVAINQLKNMITNFNHSDFTGQELLERQVRSTEDRLQTHRELQHRFYARMHRLRCLVLDCPTNRTSEPLKQQGKDVRLAKKLFDPTRSRHLGHHRNSGVSSTSSPSTSMTTPKFRATSNQTKSSRGVNGLINHGTSSNHSEGYLTPHNDLDALDDNGIPVTDFPLSANMIAELSSDRSWLFDQRELFHLFLIILVITNVIYISLGSFMRLADTATLNALAVDPASEVSDYGWHRSFGGLGWAVCSLTVGVLLSGTSVPVVRWGVTLMITNYRIAFLVFAVVASLAALCSFFMDFEYSTCDWDTQWSELRRVLLSAHFASVFFVAFFTGVCNGSIWGFLLWHFENLGASQTLIGVLEALQSISELILGYFSRRFLNSIGYIAALTLGLGVYALRFVCYAAISNPLWLIPVEILHGISFLLTWTTLVSYLGSAVPAECMTTVQGILGALYFGLGVGVGSLASGVIIDHFNAVIAFYGFAVASLAVMFLFIVSQQLFPRENIFDEKTGCEDDGDDEEKQRLDDKSGEETEEIVITPSPPFAAPMNEYVQPNRAQHLLSPAHGVDTRQHRQFLRPLTSARVREENPERRRPLSYCGMGSSETQDGGRYHRPMAMLTGDPVLKGLLSRENILRDDENQGEGAGKNVTSETTEINLLLPRSRTYTIH